MRTKTINQVKETSNYSMFKRMQGNRVVNKAHLKRLRSSINEESLIVPMIVNERYEIIDGQTRFESWKELRLPVYYVRVKGYGLKQVQRLNSNIKNWNIKDYTDSYCELGLQDYIRYREFKKEYGLGDYECIAMLKGVVGGAGSNFNSYRDGRFKIRSYSKACYWAERIVALKPFYKGYRRRSFVFAMLHLLSNKNFDFDRLIQKLKYQSSKLVDCSNKSQYINLLQDIYNFKTNNKVNLLYLNTKEEK
tara:strand:+ start:2638 stop:3384 length:747 start_codon:yes stop_codon:yes gene_type:complete